MTNFMICSVPCDVGRTLRSNCSINKYITARSNKSFPHSRGLCGRHLSVSFQLTEKVGCGHKHWTYQHIKLHRNL
jgi:hypothetical protein